MRRTWLPILVALSLAPGLATQVEAAAEKPDPEAEYEALFTEFTEAQQAFFKKQRAVYEKGGINALRRFQKEEDPKPGFIPRFQDGAAKYAPTPNAVPYLIWLLTSDRKAENDVARDALANLVVDHIESPKLEPAVLALEQAWRATGKADTAEAIAEVLANNEHVEVRAAALFVRAQIVLQDEGASSETVDTAVATLKKVLEMAPDASYAPRAEGKVFEEEHLQVGKAAPDIEGRDLDGVEFKLSDYRGKVILLDFWGNW